MISGDYGNSMNRQGTLDDPFRGVFSSEVDYAMAIVDDVIVQQKLKSGINISPDDLMSSDKLFILNELGGVRNLPYFKDFTEKEKSQLVEIGKDSLNFAFSSD